MAEHLIDYNRSRTGLLHINRLASSLASLGLLHSPSKIAPEGDYDQLDVEGKENDQSDFSRQRRMAFDATADPMAFLTGKNCFKPIRAAPVSIPTLSVADSWGRIKSKSLANLASNFPLSSMLQLNFPSNNFRVRRPPHATSSELLENHYRVVLDFHELRPLMVVSDGSVTCGDKEERVANQESQADTELPKTGNNSIVQKPFFLDGSMMFRAANADKLKTCEKSVIPQSCGQGKLATGRSSDP